MTVDEFQEKWQGKVTPNNYQQIKYKLFDDFYAVWEDAMTQISNNGLTNNITKDFVTVEQLKIGDRNVSI